LREYGAVVKARARFNECSKEMSVKTIFVQPPTFQIALALDEELSKRVGVSFSVNGQEHRIAAILLALKDLGALTSHDRGRETWVYADIDKKSNGGDVLQISLDESSNTHSVELSKRIMPTLEDVWQGKRLDPSEDQEFEVDAGPLEQGAGSSQTRAHWELFMDGKRSRK
jgi:hypothetical protein